MKILVIGATGSIGRLVVEEAIRQGQRIRALVRTEAKGRGLPKQAEVVAGDLTTPETLFDVVDGMDAVVFTDGSDGGGKVGSETVDYGGVRNILMARGSRPVRIARMTAIGVTNKGQVVITVQPSLTTGSDAESGLRDPAAYRIPSSVPVGSTTTRLTNTTWFSYGRHATPETQAME